MRKALTMKNREKAPVRRPVEREYLGALNAAAPISKWKKICQRAVDDALAGDAKAREWLSKWLMQTETRTLTVMAAEELQSDPATAVEREIADQRERINLDRKKSAADRKLTELMVPDCG